MSLPRPTKQYATQGARRDVQEQVEVRGESVVSGDEGRMKIRHMVPCSTSNSPKPSTSASSTSESPKSMIGTLAFERQPLQTMSLKNRTTGKLAEAELGPTRATLDQKKRRIRQQITSKRQELQALQKEGENIYASVGRMFEILSENLQNYAGHPVFLAKQFSEEFNKQSVAVMQIEQQMTNLRKELAILHNKVKSAKQDHQSVPVHQCSVHQSSRAENCSLSDSPRPKSPTVCGIPVVQNQYAVLEESEIVPGSEEDDEDGDYTGLINPRKTRAYRQKTATLSDTMLETQSVRSNQDKIPEDKGQSDARHPEMIPQFRNQQNFPAIVSTKEWNPKQPPTFNGKFKEDVYRWIGYMKNILTFMQGTPEQEVKYAATYLRGAAHEWWEIFIKQEGYPTNWTQLSQALLKRFGSPIRAKKAQVQLMSIKQGKRKMRDYTVEFQTLMDRLPSYDENWMINIFIWGLQPHIARSVSAAQPETVLGAINVAESIDYALRTSQKNHLTGNLRSKKGRNLKQSRTSGRKSGGIQNRNFAGKFQDSGNPQRMCDMEASVGEGLRRQFSTQRFDGHRKRNTVQQQHFSSQCTLWAQNKKGEGRIVSQKNPSTIWRDHCTSLSRKNRADLVERYGPVVVCDLAALTRVVGRTGPDISRDVKKCDRQDILSQKSRHQSNRLLRRERERRVRDSVREQRQVARLLEVAVSPSCGGTQLRTSATPRTLCEISVVTEETSSGLREKTESEYKPQRQWTSICSVRTTEKKIDEGCKIDRTPEDGVLLIVPVVIKGKICKALIDSGATRCFVSPSPPYCMM